jgi:CubicO group peptidase (beta-lactamase class C family)
VRTARLTIVVLLAGVAFAPRTAAQGLTFTLFERYLDTLREQALIPGLSAAIVQDGSVVWDRGFGMATLESFVPATAITPYPIGDLSQTFASTLLLKRCVDDGHLTLGDRVLRWLPLYSEPQTTVSQLLRHISSSGAFSYNPSRYATVTDVVEECARGDYPLILMDVILDRLAMIDSVPGEDLGVASATFERLKRERYVDTLKKIATPYRIDRGRAVRSSYQLKTLSAANGIVSSARDLAKYDAALDDDDLMAPGTKALAWTASTGVPTGLGWFVQRYNGELIVWHMGYSKDAYSSLIIKVPARHLTMILLANSDGLGSSTILSDGDVTKSLFATLFLRLAVP